jgi:hypothetical protein
MRIVLKIIHNEHIAFAWAFVVELVVHGFFGLQAFLLGGFLGELALMKVFGPNLGMQIGAWGLGIIVFGMAFVSFVLGDYLKQHVQNFVWSGRGSQEYLDAFNETVRLAAGLELSSLAFRVLTVGLHDGDWPSAILIAVAGCIGLRYAIKMAKVIHASVNRDPNDDLARSQDEAKLTLAEKARKIIKKMTPQQLAGWSHGDPKALEEAANNAFSDAERRRQEREQTRQAKQTTVLSEQERTERERQTFTERSRQADEALRGIGSYESNVRPFKGA